MSAPTKLKPGPKPNLKLYETVIKLKRTASIETAYPHTWREIAKKVGVNAQQQLHHMVKRQLGNHDNPRCPSCLQRIEKASK
jgi:hypothetical protein